MQDVPQDFLNTNKPIKGIWETIQKEHEPNAHTSLSTLKQPEQIWVYNLKNVAAG